MPPEWIMAAAAQIPVPSAGPGGAMPSEWVFPPSTLLCLWYDSDADMTRNITELQNVPTVPPRRNGACNGISIEYDTIIYDG